MADRLLVVIRNPHRTVLELATLSARVPAGTGLVGLRPRQEPLVLVVDPGLIVLRVEGGRHFAATAGGLLEGDRERVVLYTPFAVEGAVDTEVVAALERALETPDGELAARRTIGDLERRIVQELRQPAAGGRARSVHD